MNLRKNLDTTIAKTNLFPTGIQSGAEKGLQNTKSRSSKEELRLFTVYRRESYEGKLGSITSDLHQSVMAIV